MKGAATTSLAGSHLNTVVCKVQMKLAFFIQQYTLGLYFVQLNAFHVSLINPNNWQKKLVISFSQVCCR